MLNQVVTPELSYSGGMLTDGVAETGVLTETAGQRIRERSWADSNAAEVMQTADPLARWTRISTSCICWQNQACQISAAR